MKIIKVKCPYCGHEQAVDTDPTFEPPRPTIQTCESDDGGCDQDFAVYLTVNITASAHKISPEGMQP